MKQVENKNYLTANCKNVDMVSPSMSAPVFGINTHIRQDPFSDGALSSEML